MRKLIALLLLFLASAALAGDFEDGYAAANRKDYATALRLWQPLAARGLAAAQYNLGNMYLNGQGVVQDYTEAAKWFHRAAAQENAEAQHNLGVMYDRGQGVAQDYAEAVKWFRLAAAQGLANAQSGLGIMYYNGQGVVQDYVRAHMWFNLSAVSGNASSVRNRDNIAKLMTPQQIAEAQKMARECQARQFKGCD